MSECRHCWYEPNENLKICILCRCIHTLFPMKEYTQKEFEELYSQNSECPVLTESAPAGKPEK